MSFTYSEELRQIVSQFRKERAYVEQFRRIVGPFTVQYERNCERFNIPIDPKQLRLCNKARRFLTSDADTEISICPTTTAERKELAVKNSDLCELTFIIHDRISDLRLRMRLISYVPEIHEIDLEYEEL